MKFYLFLLLFISFSAFANNPDNITLYLKDNSGITGHTETTKERDILALTKIKVGEKSYPINQLDSFMVKKDVYSVIVYKDTLRVARNLFKGDVEAYKIMNEETVYLIRKKGEREFNAITPLNKFGIYNYYFKECLTKDSSVIRKQSNINDFSLTKEIVQKLNCHKTPYTVYKTSEKTRAYLLARGGFSLMKSIPTPRAGHFTSKKATPGYYAEMGLLMNVNKSFDVLVAMGYASNQTNYTLEQDNTFPVSSTSTYKGTISLQSLIADIDFRYRFLKTKVSPFVSAGMHYSYHLVNKNDYTYTNDNGQTYSTFTTKVNRGSIGLSFGAGCNYDIIKQLSIFGDLGYTFSFGFAGDTGAGKVANLFSAYKESQFRAGAGLMIRLNK